jgi:hypothetical protein
MFGGRLVAKRTPKEPLLHYKFRCRECAMVFRVRMRGTDPDPICPNLECGAAQTPIGMDVSAGKAPGVGGNVLVKAMDGTADMVMKQYGMTDLASAREGEAMAPKLPPEQQMRADAMFDPAARARLWGGMNPLGAAINQIAGGGIAAAASAAATGGQNSGIDPIAAIHSARYKPDVHIVDGKKA